MATRLPVIAIATSLVANWVASENLTGVTAKVACSHAIPAILLDPVGAALCLAFLGVLLAPFSGRFTTMSAIIIDRFGPAVGGLASCLCLLSSLLWAGAQYKAVLAMLAGLPSVPAAFLEPTVILALLSWTLLGGLVADVWLDFVSILVVAPCVLAIAGIAVSRTPAAAFVAEVVHAKQMLPTQPAANLLLTGILGNVFTEELAGRVLLAESPRRATAACIAAALIFGVVGLAPAALGIWASSVPGLLASEDGMSLCKTDPDAILAVALEKLLPSWLWGARLALSGIVVVESLTTLDTNVLMCAKVLETQAACAVPALRKDAAPWLPQASVVFSLLLVVAVSRCGDNVWELGEASTSAVGAPLGVLCLFLPWSFGGSGAALAGICVAQGVFLMLKALDSRTIDEGSDAGEGSAGMPFVWSVGAGAVAYAIAAHLGIRRPGGKKE